jgi:hypothetical protein
MIDTGWAMRYECGRAVRTGTRSALSHEVSWPRSFDIRCPLPVSPHAGEDGRGQPWRTNARGREFSGE